MVMPPTREPAAPSIAEMARRSNEVQAATAGPGGDAGEVLGWPAGPPTGAAPSARIPANAPPATTTAARPTATPLRAILRRAPSPRGAGTRPGGGARAARRPRCG